MMSLSTWQLDYVAPASGVLFSAIHTPPHVAVFNCKNSVSIVWINAGDNQKKDKKQPPPPPIQPPPNQAPPKTKDQKGGRQGDREKLEDNDPRTH